MSMKKMTNLLSVANSERRRFISVSMKIRPLISPVRESLGQLLFPKRISNIPNTRKEKPKHFTAFAGKSKRALLCGAKNSPKIMHPANENADSARKINPFCFSNLRCHNRRDIRHFFNFNLLVLKDVPQHFN
jgi:hypothetical protein